MQPINETKLHEFMNRAIGDVGAAMSAALALIGDKLGLYKALSASGPMTPDELAMQTNTNVRYIREWLANQAAGGYVTYDPAAKKYSLSPEQAFALADESSPALLPGAFQVIDAIFKAEPRMEENFRSGSGMEWSEHDRSLFDGTERFFSVQLSGESHRFVDSIATRSERKTQIRDSGGGCRLRLRLFHHFDGPGFPEIAVFRF